MNKRAIAILGAIFLLIVGTLGFLIYKKKTSTTETPSATQTPSQETQVSPITETPAEETNTEPVTQEPVTQEPVAENPTEEPVQEPETVPLSQAIRLSDNEVISPILFYQGNGIAFLNSAGQLFQTDLEISATEFTLTNTRELTIPQKAGLQKVLWPQTGNNFIAEFQNGGRKTWSVYVSDRGSFVELPPQVTSVNWMPSGDKILYVWLDSQGKSTLNIANADNTGYQIITDFWENDNEISVSPDGQNILFYETQNKIAPNKLNLVTADGKLFRSVVKDGFNLGALWSPDGKKFAFLKGDPSVNTYQVWVGNLFSGETKNSGIYASLDKIVWSADSQTLYFAGVTSVSGGVEKLYIYSVASGDRRDLDLGGSIDVREPFLTSTGDKLLFRNPADGNKLYYVDVSGK